jgi:hypothetical protein
VPPELSIAELADEFLPDDPLPEVDEDAPVVTPARRKKRHRPRPDTGFKCRCIDCQRQQPTRVDEQTAKKASK